MQQTAALIQHSLDSMHLSAQACLKAGGGITELAQNQMRALLDYARRNATLDQTVTAQEWTSRLLDHEFHTAARDTCVLATGQLIEAHATVVDAAKSVIDFSHAWLLGRVAETYPALVAEASPEPDAEVAAESGSESATGAGRARRKNGS
jgi:non-ribosomal peptide synthetase component F